MAKAEIGRIYVTKDEKKILRKIRPKLIPYVEYDEDEKKDFLPGSKSDGKKLDQLFEDYYKNQHRKQAEISDLITTPKPTPVPIPVLAPGPAPLPAMQTQRNLTTKIEENIRSIKNQYIGAVVGKISTGLGAILAFTDMIKTTLEHAYFESDWSTAAQHAYVNHMIYDGVAGSILATVCLAFSTGADYLKSKIMAHEIAKQLKK